MTWFAELKYEQACVMKQTNKFTKNLKYKGRR